MIRFTSMAVWALAVLAAAVADSSAQNSAPGAPQNVPTVNTSNPPPAPTGGAAPASASPPLAVPEAPLTNRITGIEINREMIAAEAPTAILINGTALARCGLVVHFGDGTKAASMVSESSPFPLRVTHTYPKPADVFVRVAGAGSGSVPACAGEVEVAVHVSPAGSKIEYITLTTGCPEGWLLKGEINPDKSFRCAPVPDASAPTNLIHCIDGMKYFARDGHVGCRHPGAPVIEQFALAKTPVDKGKAATGKSKAAMSNGKAPGNGREPMAKATTPPMPKSQAKSLANVPAKRQAAPQIKSAEAPN